ncbi:hypothetical protein AAG570_011678 [Ranatra chinensis]|uniref:Uncharacterized protein n=1 Tax=Ranatra chinensis TaxID=642074 RepID=A0ABD0YGL7_9HEMI
MQLQFEKCGGKQCTGQVNSVDEIIRSHGVLGPLQVGSIPKEVGRFNSFQVVMSIIQAKKKQKHSDLFYGLRETEMEAIKMKFIDDQESSCDTFLLEKTAVKEEKKRSSHHHEGGL